MELGQHQKQDMQKLGQHPLKCGAARVGAASRAVRLVTIPTRRARRAGVGHVSAAD